MRKKYAPSHPKAQEKQEKGIPKREKREKKYAPGHPSEHELQNRNKNQNNKHQSNKHKPETKARIKPETRTGNIYSRFVEKTYYMCYSNIGSFC